MQQDFNIINAKMMFFTVCSVIDIRTNEFNDYIYQSNPNLKPMLLLPAKLLIPKLPNKVTAPMIQMPSG